MPEITKQEKLSISANLVFFCFIFGFGIVKTNLSIQLI